MMITRQGVAATTALLGAVLTCLMALVGLENLTALREAALMTLAAALPLLSFGISVELLKDRPRLPASYHLWILLLGAAAGLIGITLTLAAVSMMAAGTFFATSIFTLVLSAHVALVTS